MTNDKPDYSEARQIAILQTQVLSLADTVARIEVKLDSFSQNFVSRTEFNEFKQRWLLSHTLAGVAGSVLTGVLIYLLTHKA